MKKVDFFFYFERKKDAEHLGFFLEKKEFEVVHIGPSGYYQDKSDWLLLVSRYITDDELGIWYIRLDEYAKKFGGRYDGHERLLF